MMQLYVLTPEFVRDYNGHKNKYCGLDLKPDNQGNYYLNIEAKNQFPEIDFSGLEIVSIASE